jgi:O-antigen/teichoic acid export membrane protein
MVQKNSRYKILKNASYLFISNILVRPINVIATILVARYLGVHEYGILSVALAFATVAGYFTDLGLTNTLIREGTKTNANLNELMASFFKVRLVFAVVSTVLSIIVIYILYPDAYTRSILYLIVIPTILGTALQGTGTAYFQVIQEMKYTALIRAVSGLTNALSLLIGLLFHFSLPSLASIFGLSTVISGFFSLWLLRGRVNLFSGWNNSIMKELFSFMVGGMILIILPQLGPLILEKVTELDEVGYFSAGYRIPIIIYQIPGIIAAAFYPLLFHYGNNKENDKHLQLSIVELKFMSMLGILLSLPFMFYSDWWMKILYGSDWIAGKNILMVLSMMVILQSINFPLADSLTTQGKQKHRTIILVCAFIIGVISYSFFGSFLGGLGGAIAAIVIEITQTIGFVWVNPKGFKLIFNGIKYNFLSFVIVLIFGVLFVYSQPPIIGILMFLSAYISLILLLDKEVRIQIKLFVNNSIKRV